MRSKMSDDAEKLTRVLPIVNNLTLGATKEL